MAEEDFIVSIGADSTAFFAELKNLKKGIAKELNDGQLSVQFKNALLGDLGRISKEAGQIKFDSVGTSLYKSLSTAIDEAFAARPNTLEIKPARNQETGRFQQQTTDVKLGDKEEQAAIVEAMRKRYALQDQMREGNLQGERNAAQQVIDVNRQQQRSIVQSMEMRFKAEDEAAGKRAEAQKAIQEEINSYPRLRYAMYDVANAANTLSQATLGVAAAAVTAFADYESAFTAVERTVGSDATTTQVANLRQELVQLSTEIPLAFGQLTEIASLGAQLGVAESDLTSFTDTVAKFAAVTNVSAPAAAQSFGAIKELLNVSAQDFDKLGSSIAYAGVNAVATESEILSVTTAIAGVSANAGLSTQYVLGLATSLASLRVPAEQSRGAMTRVFQEISRSAQQGGPALDEFARVIGTTRDEAQKLANSDMETFFNKFLNGLSGMDASQLTQSLDAMSLSDIRVTNTLARLSDNMDVVRKSMDDVSSSYAAGTQLNDAFGKVTDDLASKIITLNNSFTELQATAGAGLGEMLKPVLDFLTQFIGKISELGKTGVGQVILGITGAMMVLVGAAASLAAALALGFGGFLALRTAWAGANIEGIKLNSTLVQTISWLLKMPGATRPAELSMRGLGSAMVTTAGQSRVLNSAMKAMGWIGIIVAGLELASAAWKMYEDTQKTAAEKTAETAQAYFGESSGGLAEAFAKDMQSGAIAIQGINTQVASSQVSAKGWVSVLEDATGAQVALGKATTDATDIIETQTIAYSENAQKALANMLANNKAFQELFKAGGAFQITGADPEAFSKAILGDPVEGGKKYLASLMTGVQQQLNVGGTQLDFSKMIADNAAGGGYVMQAEIVNLGIELGITTAEAQELINAYTEMDAAASATAAEVEVGANAAAAATAANSALSVSEEDLAANLQATADEYKKYNDELFASVNARQDTMDAMSAFGTVLGEEGDAAAVAGGTLQATMAALIAEDPTVAAAKMQYLLEYLIANVPTATSTIAYLQQQIAKLSGGKGVSPKAFDISGFTKNLKAAGNAAASAAAKVRTLRDYASDLAKVFDRAFDIRFSSMTALDKISSGFLSIKENTENANKEISDLNATIDSLTADKALTEYFLSVAEAYGDTLRAGELRAELAKINSDLASENVNLSKAQDKTNKTLVGNSSAAIDNRKTITGLVKDYQDYIQSLASSGASQEDLAAATAAAKNDFMAQATQLGYNANELSMYAAAFDDVQVAIGNIDRGITVAANMNPALQALNEFEAQAAASGARAGKNYASAFEEETSQIDPARDKEALSKKADEFWNAVTFGKGGENAFGPLKTGYVFPNIVTEPAKKQFSFDINDMLNNGVKTTESKKDPFKNALFGVFGTANTASPFSLFNADVNNTASKIPSSIAGQKEPVNLALTGVVGPSNTAPSFNLLKTSFESTAQSIPTSIAAQRGAVNGQSTGLGQSAASSINSGLSGSLNIPGTVSSNVGAARSPAATNATSVGNSIGSNMSGGISSLLNNLFGSNSVPRKIIRSITGFSDGGYTGAGGKYDVAGVVHKGEYVVPKQDVNQSTGLPYFMQQTPQFFSGGYAGAQQQTPKTMMVELSPYDRKLLASAGNVQLRLDGKVVAQATNAVNLVSAQRGSN